jgi:hypothetical protein
MHTVDIDDYLRCPHSGSEHYILLLLSFHFYFLICRSISEAAGRMLTKLGTHMPATTRTNVCGNGHQISTHRGRKVGNKRKKSLPQTVNLFSYYKQLSQATLPENEVVHDLVSKLT